MVKAANPTFTRSRNAKKYNNIRNGMSRRVTFPITRLSRVEYGGDIIFSFTVRSISERSLPKLRSLKERERRQAEGSEPLPFVDLLIFVVLFRGSVAEIERQAVPFCDNLGLWGRRSGHRRLV